MMNSTRLKFSLLALISIVVLLTASGTGSVAIPMEDSLRIFAHQTFGTVLPEGIDPIVVSIFWKIRLPRALAAFVEGGALAVSGAVMQSLLRNPLASSYTMGVSSGASLGAALMILTGFSIPFAGAFSLPLAGFVFGLATVFLAIAFSHQLDRSMQNNTIILVGMVISLFVNALLTLLTSLAGEHLQQLIFWQMGSFSATDWQELGVMTTVTLTGILLLMRYVQEMDIMTFGEEQALSAGVELKKVKFILMAAAALMTGTAVSFTGIIGFVDLIAPHAVRKLFGSSHRIVLPASALLGGALMTLADLTSRTILSPAELPVGAVTALIGAPFFAYIYFGKRKKGA